MRHPIRCGARITPIEDVLTTGGAARDATRELRALGATVGVAVCAIDRSEVVGGPLTDVDVQTRSVLTAADLDQVRVRVRVRER